MAKSKQQIANDIYTAYWYKSRKQIIDILTSKGGTISVSKQHANTLYYNAKKKHGDEVERKLRLANTAFVDNNFSWDGMYLMYYVEGRGEYNLPIGKADFIARFKYGRKPQKEWRRFLCKHFTVLDFIRGADETSPLEMMERKGYVLPHIRKELKQRGYPVTPEGFKKMIADDIEARKAQEAA